MMLVLVLSACSSGRSTGEPTATAAGDPAGATVPSSTAPMPQDTVPPSVTHHPHPEPLPAHDTGLQADTAAPPEPDTAAPPEPDTAAPPEPDTAAPPEPDTAAPPEPDTAAPPEDTGTPREPDTGARPDTGLPEEAAPPLVARLTVDVEEGEYPLVVSFDGSTSDLGSGSVHYAWSFGDGWEADGVAPVHTYVGRGEFEAVVTVFDDVTGLISVAALRIDVDDPDCPNEEVAVQWAIVDEDYDDLSGIAASRRDSGLYWVVEDDSDDLRVLDTAGFTVSEHDLPNDFQDFEDLTVVPDPTTGVSMLFVAAIGDNYEARDDIEIWVMEEPDPRVDSDLDPLQLELTYPDGPRDAETLLVDPFTLDLFVVTKDLPGDQFVYVKRAPHDAEGPFELESLGTFSSLGGTATGGDVSADGSRIVVRDYSHTARLWFRDGYQPFEQAFDDEPCEIDIEDGPARGEGITFTADGTGLVTIGEGEDVPMGYTEL